MPHYDISFTTGNCDKCDTDTNVFLQMFGKNNGQVVSSEVFGAFNSPGDDFELGATDTFKVFSPQELGDLYAITVRSDNTGKEPGWYLVNVNIRNTENNQAWNFPYNAWVAADEPTGLTATIYENKNPIPVS